MNGQPHLGHAYEKVITDVIARSRCCLGQEVFYLPGLDEHGQAQGSPPDRRIDADYIGLDEFQGLLILPALAAQP